MINERIVLTVALFGIWCFTKTWIELVIDTNANIKLLTINVNACN